MSANPQTVPKPERIAALPVDARGYPIFFTIQNPFSGQHSFLAMVPEQVVKCIKGRLCGLCGQEMGYWIYFAGGPLSCANRVFTDPPMHRDCLDYACKVCPFIVAPNYRVIEQRSDRPADTIRSDDGVPFEDKRFGIYKTRSYRATMQRNGSILFLAAPAKNIDWIERGSGA